MAAHSATATLQRRTLGVFTTNIVVLGIGYVASIMLARFLGADGRGLVAVILTGASVLAGIGGIGTQEAATYYASRRPRRRGVVLGNGLAHASVLLVLSLVVALVGMGAVAGARRTGLRRAHLATRRAARADVLSRRSRLQPALGAERVRAAQPPQHLRAHHDGHCDSGHRRLARVGRGGRAAGDGADAARALVRRPAPTRAQWHRVLAPRPGGIAALRRAHSDRFHAQGPQCALRRARARGLRAAFDRRRLRGRADRGRAGAVVPERHGLRAAGPGREGRGARRLALGRSAAPQRNARGGLRPRGVHRRARR